MGIINFNIRFITPLLIHGVESRKCDSIGLTGKALRGSWRFWFRALMGGMVTNVTRETLLDLESRVFGSSNEETGAKFRMVITPIGNLRCNKDIEPGFPANFKFSGFSENSEFLINIIPRNSMEKEDKSILLATIWLWANLGGIGQRSRRGFGSPVIGLINNTNPFQELELPIITYFSNQDGIKRHLQDGLNKVGIIFEKWLQNKYSVNGNIITNPLPKAKYFVISSLKQTVIGDNPYSNIYRAIEAAHGNDQCKDLGWARDGWRIPDFAPEQLKSPSRMASPIYTRFHLLENKTLLPVITWCEQDVPIKTEIKINNRWVENNRNLIIPDKKCLESYLKGGTCKHGIKFSGLGVKIS